MVYFQQDMPRLAHAYDPEATTAMDYFRKYLGGPQGGVQPSGADTVRLILIKYCMLFSSAAFYMLIYSYAIIGNVFFLKYRHDGTVIDSSRTL